MSNENAFQMLSHEKKTSKALNVDPPKGSENKEEIKEEPAEVVAGEDSTWTPVQTNATKQRRLVPQSSSARPQEQPSATSPMPMKSPVEKKKGIGCCSYD